MDRLIIGTRGSALALWQANAVKRMLEERQPGLRVELEIIKTVGDRDQETALSRFLDKGLFTKELETAMFNGRTHVAVHSLKDMQSVLPEGLVLGAVPQRHAPEDVLVAASGMTIDKLPEGGTVATGALRRRAQLKHLRPDLNVVEVRGNVQTRLRKLRENGWDGMIMARAGLERLGNDEVIAQIIPAHVMVPAVGQGALGVEARADNPEVLELLALIDDQDTRVCVEAERAMLRMLEGGCQAPIAAHALLAGETLRLDGLVATLDGREVVRRSIEGSPSDPEGLGERLAEELMREGAGDILAELRSENSGSTS